MHVIVANNAESRMHQTIHRRMGTHISRVKSLSLDIWTKEQVESMRDNGNIKSNALFNPNPRLNPAPLDLESEHAESQLERFIFQKYRDRAFMDKPKKKSRAPATSDLSSSTSLPAAAMSWAHAPAPVATIREDSASYRSGDSAPSTARTPAVSVTSPQSAGARAFSPPAMPIATQQPPTHLSAAAALAGRAMTAPLPDYSTRSLSTSVSSNQSFNPFHRQMTASAQIPSTTGMPSQVPSMGYSATGINAYQPMSNASYPQSSMPSSYGQMPMYKPVPMPLSQSNPPKGEIWQDLAGLSMSNGGMQVQQPMLSQFNGYQSSTANTMPMLQTNPFLQSSMMTYKAPSQISSMSSGSSYSSLGSGTSATFSPNTAQMPQQTSNIPTYQYQTQTLAAPQPNGGMSYMGMNNQQQQQQQPQQQTNPVMQQQPPQQPTYQFHASNPYASQFTQVQQPYLQYVQSQYQGM